ncbi:hypothetical protein ACFVVM_29085 [Nocardia sp. NPDC058176]|uniref:hypothetical protein n=1 Tax=Nocardia sp. NPDC058176 TaxID=3346368 RepID=UPI0036DC84AC
MTSQGDSTSGAAAKIAAVLSVVVAGACGVFVLLIAVLAIALEQEIGTSSGTTIAVAVGLEVPILIWLAGAVLMMFRRPSGRWIVAVCAGLGVAFAAAAGLAAGSDSGLWAAAAALVCGLVFCLTVSGSTGRWMARGPFTPPGRGPGAW